MTEQQQEPTTEPEGAQGGTGEPVEGEEKQYPESYVRELRTEAAENRKKAERVDSIRDALRAAVLEKASAGILREPLTWSDDYDGEDGMPDVSRVTEAVEALANEKPWLSRPRGDAGQGFRGTESDAVDLASMLRAGA